jgi:hypothetical protein
MISPPRRVEVKELAPERFKLQLTISRATHDKLRRIQDLLRHRVPDGDLATIVDKALTLLLEDIERAKPAAAPRPRSRTPDSTTRHIPAAVKRAVWDRDGGRCAFRAARVAAKKPGFSNSIMSFRMRQAERRASTIFSSAAARTTRWRPSGGSATRHSCANAAEAGARSCHSVRTELGRHEATYRYLLDGWWPADCARGRSSGRTIGGRDSTTRSPTPRTRGDRSRICRAPR